MVLFQLESRQQDKKKGCIFLGATLIGIIREFFVWDWVCGNLVGSR
jgi:hypothetical protein